MVCFVQPLLFDRLGYWWFLIHIHNDLRPLVANSRSMKLDWSLRIRRSRRWYRWGRFDDVDARDDGFEDIVAFGYEAKSGGDAGFGAAVYHGVSVTGGEIGI
jgi:cellulase/cellobiase CelA1